MSNLQQVGWRCVECGRMDPNSNQPCVEHGDVEPVYRVLDEAEFHQTVVQCRRTRG